MRWGSSCVSRNTTRAYSLTKYTQPSLIEQSAAHVARIIAEEHSDIRLLLGIGAIFGETDRRDRAIVFLDTAIDKALGLISKLVVMHLRTNQLDDIRCSANYMQRFDKIDGILHDNIQTHCASPSMPGTKLWQRKMPGDDVLSACSGVLLATNSTDKDHNGFWIPLFAKGTHPVWGAPMACMHATTAVVFVDDLPLWPPELHEFQRNVEDYIKHELNYKMFVSLPVRDERQAYVVGVVNVNLNREFFSLYSERRREQLLTSMADLLLTVGLAAALRFRVDTGEYLPSPGGTAWDLRRLLEAGVGAPTVAQLPRGGRDD